VFRSASSYWLVLALVLGLLSARPGVAQDRSSVPDSVRQRSDPAAAASSRSRSGPDASSAGVEFTASDSLVIRMPPDSADQGTLHGEAQMSYQGATLKAGTIEVNFQTSVLEAFGPPSDTAAQQRPTFQRGSDGGTSGSGRGSGGGGGLGGGAQSFSGKTLSYSLETKRGRVVTARTEQQQGYVEGDAVKVYEDSTLFVQQGTYTTCDCPPGETPSYSLRSSRMKVQDQWVYTGPINLYLFNIPTPLWLPFGFLPNVSGRRSGPMAPSYGQDQRKGLFLRDFGWYFALNAYTDLQLQGSVWSQGSFEINPIFRYKKRYNYDGQLDLTYRRTQIGEEEDPNFTNQHRGQLKWSHDQNLSPSASIRGRINLVTSTDFARRNSNNYDDAVSQEISSNLKYSKDWGGGSRSLQIRADQRQQLQSGEVSMTLPSLNFSQRSFKPFEVEQAVGEDRWYEKITTPYNFSLSNDYSFRPRNPENIEDSTERARVDDIAWYEALFDREKYQRATGNDEPFDFQATHELRPSASFRINRYNLSLSPSVSYTSDWYINTTRKVVDLARDEIDRDTTDIRANTTKKSIRGFYARRDLSTGLSANTELYGLFPLRVGPLEGLRHRMSPSLSFNYSPNFNAPFWGRTRTLRYQDGTAVKDTTTNEPIRYDILGGNRVRGSNERRSLSFSLDNELETKYVRIDSTGERREEKIKLLDFDLNTSYNFTADSLKLSDLRLRARTKIKDFSVQSSMRFSPYALRSAGSSYRRIDRYMAAESPLTPLRLTRFALTVSGSFQSSNPNSGQGSSQSGQSGTRSRPRGYLTSPIPWSLNFDFSYNVSKPAKRVANQKATVNASVSLNVTPQWSLEGRTGYDFIQNDVATTSININRDLGCWVMSFSWVPFGRRQSYSFNLQVKSGKLSQLLRLQIPNSGQDGPLGGFGQRLRGTVQSATGQGGPSF